MDFNSMGSLDAQNEIRKFGIDTSKGELKAATIRTTAPFLDLLTHVSETMGVSRQSFMSKVIEQLSAEAVADYLAGYADYMNINDIDAKMFLNAPDSVDKELLKNFSEQVESNLLRMRLNAEGVNALPDDNPLKSAFFRNQLKSEYANFKLNYPDQDYDNYKLNYPDVDFGSK